MARTTADPADQNGAAIAAAKSAPEFGGPKGTRSRNIAPARREHAGQDQAEPPMGEVRPKVLTVHGSANLAAAPRTGPSSDRLPFCQTRPQSHPRCGATRRAKAHGSRGDALCRLAVFAVGEA
jgi:hypothetical protein